MYRNDLDVGRDRTFPGAEILDKVWNSSYALKAVLNYLGVR